MTAQSADKAQPAPCSSFGGVQIGVITYSYRSMPSTAEDVLKYVVQCGINFIQKAKRAWLYLENSVYQSYGRKRLLSSGKQRYIL